LFLRLCEIHASGRISASCSNTLCDGIFGPSLFLGAMLGGAIGAVAHGLLPGCTATSRAYALVGMGALFAGIVRSHDIGVDDL
jgi:CIC family chloride channel protein